MSDAQPQSTRLSVLIPFGIVCLIWGSTWIVIRDQISFVPPGWSVAYRFGCAGAAMLAWAAWRGDSLRLDRRGVVFALLLALTQFMLNFNFVYRAEQHITSGVVAVLYALLLVPNAVLARIFLGQRMGRQLILGSVIAVAGIGLLFLHEVRLSEHRSADAMLGIGLALTGILCASIANVMQATETSKAYPLSTMLGWSMLIGSAAGAVIAWVTTGSPQFDPRPAYLAGILYLGLFGSAISFSLYFALIRTIGPTKAAYTGAIIPVIAMLISTAVEGYRWSLLAAGGAVLVLAGLVIALTARRPNR